MTGMMVLRNPEWNKPKVGGFDWVSRRLYPIVAERCPDHPLIAEARRDALERTLDLHSALRWLSDLRSTKFRRLDAISPFAAAWLEPYGTESEEPVRFESPDITLQRLHERLFDSAAKELCP
jgi:Lhr-like helicase